MINPQALAPGTELVQDYRIEGILGAGGFGITYLAEEVPLARSVTLKEYFPADFAARDANGAAVPRSESSGLDFTWGLDRFVDEAQILARFDHPNIVKVYRYFRTNGTAYMALKWEEGQSLKSWAKALGRTPRQPEIDDILRPLLDALEVVHASDFLHRDIAPDNIIIRTDGSPVLIDFGSARGDLAQRSRTVSALVKPGYSPYEQYAEDGAKQGPWSDIYALSATLYHLITGKRPPDAPSRIVSDDFRSARDAALGSFRPAFLQAIDQGLALDLDKRPQSVAEWRKKLFKQSAKRGIWPGSAGAKAEQKQAADEAAATVALAETRPLTPSQAPPAINPLRRRAQEAPAAAAAPPARPAAKPRQAQAQAQTEHSPRRGGLMSRLGRNRQQQPASPAASPAPAQTPPAAPTAQRQQRAGAGFGFAALRERFARRSDAGPKVIKAARARPAQAAPRPPGTPAGRAIQAIAAQEQLPVPVPAKKRKPPRLRRTSPIRWRSLAFKLVLGGLIAAGAVSLQQSLPQYITERNTKLTTATVPSFLLGQFQAHQGGVSKIAFTADGRYLVTAGADRTLKLWGGAGSLWDSRYRSIVRTMTFTYGPVTALHVRGMTAVTGHAEGAIAIWDLSTGREIASLKRNDARVWSVRFIDATTKRIAVAAHDWTVTLWDYDQPQTPIHVFAGHGNAVQSLAIDTTNALMITGSADKSIRVWDLAALSLSRMRGRAHGDFVTALTLSRDGTRLVSGDLSGNVRTWSGAARSRLRRIRAHQGPITAIAFLPGGKNFATASKDGRLIVWNLRRGRAIRTFGSRGTPVNTLAVSPNGKIIATGGADGNVRIWETSPRESG